MLVSLLSFSVGAPVKLQDALKDSPKSSSAEILFLDNTVQKHGDINFTFSSSYLTHVMTCPGVKHPIFSFCVFYCSVICAPSLRESITSSIESNQSGKRNCFKSLA